jgi:RNA polymerase sigma-70 factor, ECF subfamily
LDQGCVTKMNATIRRARPPASGVLPLAAWTDERLLLEYRSQRDERVFEELVKRYENELYGYLRHYLGGAEMAEDVFQQAFLQVHLKCDQFEPGRKVRPWIYAIATNQAIDYQRRNQRHRVGSLDRLGQPSKREEARAGADLLKHSDDGPAEGAELAERREALRRAVDELPEQSRQIVTMVYFQGLKCREAAETLLIPVGTVKSRLHTAMQRLTETLAHVGSH